MDGITRVIVFCILIVVLPATFIILPIYLRQTVFGDVVYPVAESDIIEIRDGISSIFCQKHSLHMNTNFNAFQLRTKPEISTNRKHIRLKKSMTLPDDTLEYWGFYLLKGARVHLKFCSRYDGSRILVVKGPRDLKTCGLLDHNQNKVGVNFAQGLEQVKVFFEDIKEIASNAADDLGFQEHRNVSASANFEEENHGGEDMDEYEIEKSGDISTTTTRATPTSTTKAHHKKLKRKWNSTKIIENTTMLPSSNGDLLDPLRNSQLQDLAISPSPLMHQKRYAHNEHRSHLHQESKNRQRRRVYDTLFKQRVKRDHVYDRKYSHGGNAVNFTETDESNSISSFENSLLECYNGAILLAEGFRSSPECTNAHFLENGSHRMLSKHDITEDGYYYYIFYSDNDLVRNDIHAIFDIYKPTFQYSNLTDSKTCVNSTNCTFPINFLSDEIVVVEVPTRDGIEHEEDDITNLISTCHPRWQIFAIFPTTAIILILCCSFL